MPNEGGNFLQRIPVWVWVGGAAVIAYFLFFRNSSSSNQPSTSGGGGQVTTGATTIKKGAVNVSISQDSGGGPDKDTNSQPGPPPPPSQDTKSFTVPKNETWGQFGASRHWSENTLNELDQFTQPAGSTYAGKILNPDSPLKKGDTVFRPIKSTSDSSS